MTNNAKILLGIVAVVLVVVVGSVVMNQREDRPINERVGDAISNMDARELQNRTPAERIGDAVNDAAQ